jgi:hypothetical protein
VTLFLAPFLGEKIGIFFWEENLANFFDFLGNFRQIFYHNFRGKKKPPDFDFMTSLLMGQSCVKYAASIG